MAKDHFVPQHYLRQFGINARVISIATLSPYRFIAAGPIDGQCQEDNFYERNERLNDLLWKSETDLAPVLKRVAQKQDFDVKESNALKFLAVIFHMRTRKAADIAKVFPKYMASEVIRSAIERGELPPPPQGVEKLEEVIDFKGASGLLMQQVICCWMEMATLDCKLLLATGSDHFITSDNPVSILNQFCAGLEPYRRVAGFSKSGFQLLLPIDPRLCFFCYDAKVYKVGNRRDRVVTISKQDVEIVNALQVQSAEECLYSHDPRMEQEVGRLVTRYTSSRVPIDDTLRVIPGKDENEEMLHIRAHSVNLPAPWHFCRYRRRIHSQPGDRRDPAWTALGQRLTQDIEENPEGGDVFRRIEKILGESESPFGLSRHERHDPPPIRL
ncbi:MAG TPA: DUF4238 domain-containing protein [Candidatus Acidoferrum sp.]|jgi:hypothetical protein|nr:DUF4238 domain-containing protein [Candidatus Acidoferrum sp.]